MEDEVMTNNKQQQQKPGERKNINKSCIDKSSVKYIYGKVRVNGMCMCLRANIED